MNTFKRILSVLLTVVIILSCTGTAVSAKEGTILPSSWAATDGLGRTLSRGGERREGKFVGMFYWIWHYPWCRDWYPINTTEVLAAHPEAKYDFYNEAWGNYSDGVPQFWDKPLFGYYSDLDEYVLRKHAELIADADIDVIIFDATNDTKTFKEGYDTLFRVWEEAKLDGVKVPKIAFMLPFSDDDCVRTDLLQLYDDIYSAGRYEDLWFYWEGKPLVMGNPDSLNKKNALEKEIASFFTFRDDEPGYFAADTLYKKRGVNKWGWCSEYPQTLFGKKNLFGTKTEQICVSVAQNCNEYGLCAMNSAEGTVQGRSYAKGKYSYTYTYAGKEITVDKNTENALLYGLNFQQQWDYALKKDPDFIFVTGFNEWIAGRFKEWAGTKNASPDQYSPEYSRDIEPSAGVLKDYYYYQLCENVRRFKGTDKEEAFSGTAKIDINAGTEQWAQVTPEYVHYTGSTRDRSMAGWKGTYYENRTMCNDIVSAKVTYDENNVYFLVTAKDEIKNIEDSGSMRLFLDTDESGVSSNWESFEYVINRNVPDAGTVTVERSAGGWNFEKTGTAQMSVSGKTMQFSVPKEALGFKDGEDVSFNFKWSDNMQTDGDITDFYQNGDVAPGGRFTFRFNPADETQTEKPVKAFFGKIAGWFRTLWQRIVSVFKK